jgi:hypothetical protein
MRARSNRQARVKRAIDVSPVRRGVLREAYEWDEERDAVLQRVCEMAKAGRLLSSSDSSKRAPTVWR